MAVNEKKGVDCDSEQWKIAEAFKQIYSLKGREIYKERDIFLSMFKDLYSAFNQKLCRLIGFAIDCGAFAMVMEMNGNDDAVCMSAVQKMVDEYGTSEALAADVIKSIAWSIGKNTGSLSIEKKPLSLPEKKEEPKQVSPKQDSKGRAINEQKECVATIATLKSLAESGNADARYKLGNAYYSGRGVSRDYAEAVKWYRKAAVQGNADAQYKLGNAYYSGHGVSKDYAEAVKWYQKAAEQGNADAEYVLGNAYVWGQGVAWDHAEAMKWYRKSAEQGNADAQAFLGDAYYLGQGVARNYSEAVKWYRRAAEQGNASAQYNLGWCLKYGIGCMTNINEAQTWLQKAAKKGNQSAIRELSK